MPVAAVPNYIPQQFIPKATPGLRWGPYLSIWMSRADQIRELEERAGEHGEQFIKSRTDKERLSELITRYGKENATDRLIGEQEIEVVWSKSEYFKNRYWDSISAVTVFDKKITSQWLSRQDTLFNMLEEKRRLRLTAKATSPFTTGLGNEHPLENGFSFLNPYGLPYLPGSGVKGVVREAARQLSEGQWEDSRGWDKEPVGSFTVRVDGEGKKIPLTALDVLFGRETPEGESEHFRGVLSFWDVIPEIPGNQLRVEVMTPHQSHYYQQERESKTGGSTTPHDSGQPKPILFLTVPPGSKFHFHVVCDLERLKRVAPAMLAEDRWKKLLEAAFQHAFDWLGFGAKTAVGYGAMRRQTQNTPESAASAPQGTTEKKPTAAPAAEEQIWENATLKWNPGNKELSASAPGKTSAILTQKAAQEFLNGLPDELREQLKKKKSLGPVAVRVRAEGNKYTIVGLAQPE